MSAVRSWRLRVDGCEPEGEHDSARILGIASVLPSKLGPQPSVVFLPSTVNRQL